MLLRLSIARDKMHPAAVSSISRRGSLLTSSASFHAELYDSSTSQPGPGKKFLFLRKITLKQEMAF